MEYVLLCIISLNALCINRCVLTKAVFIFMHCVLSLCIIIVFSALLLGVCKPGLLVLAHLGQFGDQLSLPPDLDGRSSV